jgi:hypothetical protein
MGELPAVDSSGGWLALRWQPERLAGDRFF